MDFAGARPDSPRRWTPRQSALRSWLLPQPLFGARIADELFRPSVRFVGFDPPAEQDRFLEYPRLYRRTCTWEARLSSAPIMNGAIDLPRTRSTSGRLRSPPNGPAASARFLRPAKASTPRRGCAAPPDRGLAVAASPTPRGELFEAPGVWRGFERFMKICEGTRNWWGTCSTVGRVGDRERGDPRAFAGWISSSSIDDVAIAAGLLFSPSCAPILQARLARNFIEAAPAGDTRICSSLSQ